MAHELVTEYGQIVDAKLRASLVTKDNVIFNTYYEGVPTAGAVKIPVRDGEAEVADYNKTSLSENGIKYGSTEYITAVISQDKYVNEYIDGYEAEAVPDNLVADRLDSAGFSLANTEDSHALQTLVNGAKGQTYDGSEFSDSRSGKTGRQIDKEITKENVYEIFVDMMVALDEAKVPADIELEMFVDEDVPTVFYAQAFCSKTHLAKFLADKYNGLYLDIDDKVTNSVKAKVEAFLNLR